MKRTLLIPMLIATGLTVGGTAFQQASAEKGGKGGGGGGDTLPALMTIDDDFLGGPYLLSDGKGSYTDYRLEGGDPCVTAWVKKDGFFFIYTNRGSGHGFDCDEYYPVQERWYRLKFPAGSGACQALGLDVENGTCEQVARRASGEPFARKASESPTSFMFHSGGNSYSLDCVADISGSGDLRTLTNASRTCQLMQISSPPQKPSPVGSPFFFPFGLTIERVAQ